MQTRPITRVGLFVWRGASRPTPPGHPTSGSRATPPQRADCAGNRRLGLLLLCLSLFPCFVAVCAHAQGNKPPARETQPSLGDRVNAALAASDWPKSEELLKEQVEKGEGGFVPYFNLACIRSIRGDADDAAEWLIKSIERGFCDKRQLQRDGFLRPLHNHPTYKKLLEQWPTILQRRVDTDIKMNRDFFREQFIEDRDDKLRVVTLSTFDEKARAQAKREIALVNAWAERELFPGLSTSDEAKDDPWVLIVLPKRDGFVKWSVAEWGPAAMGAFGAIGGAYSHDEKRLVSQDIGATLRHEFLHVLQWRLATRLDQRYPIYIQEGLCSLVEDYDLSGGDQAKGELPILIPSTSWRTNIAKRREKHGTLMSIADLAKMNQDRFTASSPLANYAMARTLFLWLQREGKLAEWHKHYIDHFHDDPTGVKSIEAVMGATGKDLDKKWKAWVRALPEVPEEILKGMASLGMEVEAGDGDGCRVVKIGADPARFQRPQTSIKGETGDVRIGDIIRTIDGKPVREMAELVRVLGSCEVGQVVALELRRGRGIESCTFKLIAKP